ncbi:MAG: hypothetical protein RLQ25_08535 [Alphaproteobacteria bacterium]|uniref:hypothetical protein n=1 Tax=Marinobacter salarius TaxID=1420917 RepID=UPI0032EB3D1F
MSADKLREAIFNINTRRFGTVCEAIVAKIAEFGASRNQFHDLYCDKTDSRIEVKFSRVQNKAQIAIQPDTVVDAIFAELDENRTIMFDKWRTYEFDCNIQQIKCSEFEILYYGLFFWDKLLIFRINSETIKIDQRLNYSDKQHKGNVGEGQFHINNKTLQHHIDTYLAHDMSYTDLLGVLSN